jgi:DNA polymerase III subunit delta
VLPAIKSFDEQIAGEIAAWQSAGAGEKQGRENKGGSKTQFDLALAANPYNAYPIYQTLVKSDNYSIVELVAALAQVSRVDVRLKTTGQDPAAVLASLVVSICRKVDPAPRRRVAKGYMP